MEPPAAPSPAPNTLVLVARISVWSRSGSQTIMSRALGLGISFVFCRALGCMCFSGESVRNGEQFFLRVSVAGIGHGSDGPEVRGMKLCHHKCTIYGRGSSHDSARTHFDTGVLTHVHLGMRYRCTARAIEIVDSRRWCETLRRQTCDSD